ncbi:MAG: glycosyltransferase family 2 protein [Alphaproteobacteria bacterium]|nr:glycosyltransferase family 2 protein [Alphaproteobacteria bacterium]
MLRGGLWSPVLTNRPYRVSFPRAIPLEPFADDADLLALDAKWAVLRKRRIYDLSPALLHRLATHYHASLEAPKYIVLGRKDRDTPRIESRFFDTALAAYSFNETGAADASPLFDATKVAPAIAGEGRERAALVTTFNRPKALGRSLPTVVALGLPTLVVDDGSSPDAAAENRTIVEGCGARYLCLPTNRGVAAALNVGIEYWLADPDVKWISYFQDDVNVDRRLIDVISKYEDPERQPMLSGFDTNRYEPVRVEQDGEFELKYKKYATGMHLHGHRTYWAQVMPIPSNYLGAPKPGQDSAHEDTWVVTLAPRSLINRGLLMLCVPDLVTTFAIRKEDSTWGNQHLADWPVAGKNVD